MSDLLITRRVVSRYLESQTRSIYLERSVGSYRVFYLKQHAEMLDHVSELLLTAEKKYRAAGVPLKHEIAVYLDGGKVPPRAGAAYFPGNTPPIIKIPPKSYQISNLIFTLIHELGHYYHDKVVPGGFRNQEVLLKYAWAMRQKRTQGGGKIDILDRRRKQLEALLKRLEAERVVRKPLPRKGQIFEFDQYVNSVKYHVKAKMLGKRDSQTVNVEVLEAPDPYRFRQSVYQRGTGPLVVPVDITTLTFTGIDPTKESEIAEVREQLTATYKEEQQAWKQEDDRYEVQQSDWIPTTYSRKNEVEWFAEMLVTLVTGHLKPDPTQWILAVIGTGKPPLVDPG